MPDPFKERLDLFSANTTDTDSAPLTHLTNLQRGIERECLRITPEGKLASTPHPPGLGSALTHPHITTDFSEALMELITPVSNSIEETLDFLNQVHTAVYPELDGEVLWSASMPCILNSDESIPVAQYGSSNIAKMKTTYRKGLGHRYGRLMQTIAGIHYNFSLPDELWQVMQKQDLDKRSLQDYKTDSYFKLIRNFKRSSWLLIYLYGASPAVCKSFLREREHHLEPFDHGSFHLPYGTALRMGDLGYQSSAQEDLNICYNHIDNYIDTLNQAITNIHPEYGEIGVEVDGEYQQLSAALLQIENEFYSPIRPKRVTESGEIPLGALKDRGIEYIEVRCIDVNPYLPLGIDADQIRFLDCYLLYCLFNRSPMCDDLDRQIIDDNFKRVVDRGRDPQLTLNHAGKERGLKDWGEEIIEGVTQIAALLDKAHGTDDYQRVCREQIAKLADPSLTPSAKILSDMSTQDIPFFKLAMKLSQQHSDHFNNNPLTQSQAHYFKQQSILSDQKRSTIEADDTLDFGQFLQNYYRQYDTL